ncbi:TIGR04086 family membrane protein, partial [Dysosmobacter welbionis]
LCAVECEVGKPPAALLDGHAVLQELLRKILDGERFVQRFSDNLAQFLLVGFKACRLGGLTLCGKGGVFLIQCSLSLFPRPILALSDAVCAAVQKVDLIKPSLVAQLHDLGLEIFHRRVGTAVLASSFCVRWSVHIGQQRHI